jgi:hypothetical protein
MGEVTDDELIAALAAGDVAAGYPSRGLPVNHCQVKAPGTRKAPCIQSGMLPSVGRPAGVRGSLRPASHRDVTQNLDYVPH